MCRFPPWLQDMAAGSPVPSPTYPLVLRLRYTVGLLPLSRLRKSPPGRAPQKQTHWCPLHKRYADRPALEVKTNFFPEENPRTMRVNHSNFQPMIHPTIPYQNQFSHDDIPPGPHLLFCVAWRSPGIRFTPYMKNDILYNTPIYFPIHRGLASSRPGNPMNFQIIKTKHPVQL